LPYDYGWMNFASSSCSSPSVRRGALSSNVHERMDQGRCQTAMSWLNSVLDLVGGLALLLFAMAKLADLLKEVAGERMRTVMGRLTKSPFTGLLTGCVATIVLDSSSVTIILVIALVHAAVLSFEQSLAVILGSNIGTTISTFVFALEVDRFSPVFLIIGLVLAYFLREERTKQYGWIVFFAGLMLFGLHLMGASMKPIAGSEELANWMKGLEDPVRGAFFGAAATALIQSSSAMMGIVVKLASAGAMTLPAGIAVMLGAEIGTCADTLLASMGRTREALRAGVFHLGFNVVSVCLGLVFYKQISYVATMLPGAGVSKQIAIAHIFFNTAGALLFLPLIPLASKALNFLLPSASAMSFEPGAQPDSA
jgi:phosphate:Na+ symporter